LDYNQLMAWDMIGHQWAVELLRRHLAQQRVRHAYLFTGPDGIGKRTLALCLAQALNCEAPPSPGEACGVCRACRLIPQGTHPDLHLVTKQEGDAQIKMEQVLELQRQLALAPFESRWRIALGVGFHDASISAQNALLKTLEEPSPRVVLLLTARQAELLLPTIVSRCEVVALRPLAAAELADALTARGETAERAKLLSALAGGRPGVALRTASNPERLEERSGQLDDLRALLRSSRVEQFGYVERLVGRKRGLDLETKRREAEQLLEAWLSLWRDAMVVAYGAQASLGNPDCFADLERMVRTIGAEGLLGAVQATERTLEAVRKNANLQLALETLMLDLPRFPARA